MSRMHATPRPSLVIVSGLSGSGKSVALKTFEDLGYLLRRQPAGGTAAGVRAQRRCATTAPPQKIAVGIDVRNRHSDLAKMPEWLSRGRRAGAGPEAAVLRHPRRSAAAALCRHPPPASAEPPRPGAAGSDLAASARCSRRCAQIADVRASTPATLNVHQLRRADHHRIRAQRRRVAVAAVRILRLQARRAGRRGLRVRRAGAAQPALGSALRPLSGRDGDGARLPGSAAGSQRSTSARSAASSTPGCRGCAATRAATSPSPSAAPAAGTARCTWPNGWPQHCPRPGLGGSGDLPSRTGLTSSGSTGPARYRACDISSRSCPDRRSTPLPAVIPSAKLPHGRRHSPRNPSRHRQRDAGGRHAPAAQAAAADRGIRSPVRRRSRALLPQASAALRRVDGGEGVLVLTDLYGASPSNLAAQLARLGTPVRRVSALSLPMLLRVMNYAGTGTGRTAGDSRRRRTQWSDP